MAAACSSCSRWQWAVGGSPKCRLNSHMTCDHGHDRRAGDVCLPRGVDEHVHFGLSFGGTMSVTWETESIAAAVGGTPARCGASRPVPRLTPRGRAIFVSRYGTPVRGPCQGPSGLHRVSCRLSPLAPLPCGYLPVRGTVGALPLLHDDACAAQRHATVEDLVTSFPTTGPRGPHGAATGLPGRPRGFFTFSVWYGPESLRRPYMHEGHCE
jgi:hypothetical protein